MLLKFYSTCSPCLILIPDHGLSYLHVSMDPLVPHHCNKLAMSWFSSRSSALQQLAPFSYILVTQAQQSKKLMS